jgi:hypothetical protein
MEPRLELQATPVAHGWRRMILGSRAGYNPTEMTKAAEMQQARFRFYAEVTCFRWEAEEEVSSTRSGSLHP